MFPRWLSWLFVGVMLYMIYASSQSHDAVNTPVTTVIAPVISEKNYPALAAMTDVERWKRTLNPDYAATHQCALDAAALKDGLTLKVIEDVAGDGDGAQCGETVTIRLTVWNNIGGKAFEGELPLALGARAVAAGLDVGLLGVKVNGIRTLVLPPAALVRHQGEKAHDAARKALPVGKVATVTVQRLK